jgi:hypothetical protein
LYPNLNSGLTIQAKKRDHLNISLFLIILFTKKKICFSGRTNDGREGTETPLIVFYQTNLQKQEREQREIETGGSNERKQKVCFFPLKSVKDAPSLYRFVLLG